MNDGISPDFCSIHYASIDNAAKIMCAIGRGARLAKLDIALAYRNVSIHPHDRPLLGMEWEGNLYIDTVLPLRSAPKVISALTDGLEWILTHQGVTHCLHYLDVILTIAHDATQSQTNLQTMVQVCAELGFPIKQESSTLTFLRIKLDSMEMQMRLPFKARPPKTDHRRVDPKASGQET